MLKSCEQTNTSIYHSNFYLKCTLNNAVQVIKKVKKSKSLNLDIHLYKYDSSAEERPNPELEFCFKPLISFEFRG